MLKRNQSNETKRSSLLLTGLASTATKDDLLGLFSQFGTIKDVSISVSQRLNKTLHSGVIKFESDRSAIAARAELNGIMLLGEPLRIGWAQTNGTSGKSMPMYRKIHTAQIHVSYISEQVDMLVTNDSIHQLFSRFGSVLSVSIVCAKVNLKDTPYRQHGHGFVHFSTSIRGITSAFNAVKALSKCSRDNVFYDCELSHQIKRYLTLHQVLVKNEETGQDMLLPEKMYLLRSSSRNSSDSLDNVEVDEDLAEPLYEVVANNGAEGSTTTSSSRSVSPKNANQTSTSSMSLKSTSNDSNTSHRSAATLGSHENQHGRVSKATAQSPRGATNQEQTRLQRDQQLQQDQRHEMYVRQQIDEQQQYQYQQDMLAYRQECEWRAQQEYGYAMYCAEQTHMQYQLYCAQQQQLQQQQQLLHQQQQQQHQQMLASVPQQVIMPVPVVQPMYMQPPLPPLNMPAGYPLQQGQVLYHSPPVTPTSISQPCSGIIAYTYPAGPQVYGPM